MTLNQKVEHAKELIREYVEKYPNQTEAGSMPTHAFSFSGGKDSAVMLDIAYKALGEYPQSFAVLSNTEFPETNMMVKNTPNCKTFLYYNSGDPSDCCRSEKVATFKKAVRPLKVWFSGIRADEGVTRDGIKEVEERDGLIKVNPLANFTETDIWRYAAIHGLKLNPRYAEGYRSLSCQLCSTVEKDGAEGERAGRWEGTEHAGKECGIHTESLRK